MEIISVKCPCCNANINIENVLESFYCSHCGRQLFVEGLDKDVYVAHTKIEEINSKERANIRKNEIKKYRIDQEKEIEQSKIMEQNNLERYRISQTNAMHRRSVLYDIVVKAGPVLALIGFFIYWGWGVYKNDEDRKKEYESLIINMESIVQNIEQNIKNEDYDSALLYANKLYFDPHYNDEYEVWNEKRENYIALINEKARESELKNPDFIFMPSDSKKYLGKEAPDIEAQLISVGFSNVSTQPSSIKASLLHKKGTIEHIIVGGETEFTSEDYFHKDSTIVIYYYTE